MKRFEQELPQGYVEAKVVDAKNSKTSIILTLVSLVVTAVVFVIGWLICKFAAGTNLFDSLKTLERKDMIVGLAVFFGSYFAYIILHELVHGLIYKIFTKQKLTFGMALAVAFCGVPNIYVYRTVAILSLLAPFTVFSVVLAIPLGLLGGNAWLQLVMLAMYSLHVGGCTGDLYDTILYAFKFRDGSVLMRDTGPKQTFYVLETSALGREILAKRQQKAAEQPADAPAEQAVAEEAVATVADVTESSDQQNS